MEKTTIEIEDVGGSFARFLKTAPKVARAELAAAVKLTAFSLGQRMRALAPGPSDDPPHLKDDISLKARGLSASVGILDDDEQAHIALYNEYDPNQQPFMLPAAKAHESEFVHAVTKALKQVEQQLSGGGLL